MHYLDRNLLYFAFYLSYITVCLCLFTDSFEANVERLALNDITVCLCLFTDSIEANVERSALNVDCGTEQLLHARDYRVCIHRQCGKYAQSLDMLAGLTVFCSLICGYL